MAGMAGDVMQINTSIMWMVYNYNAGNKDMKIA